MHYLASKLPIYKNGCSTTSLKEYLIKRLFFLLDWQTVKIYVHFSKLYQGSGLLWGLHGVCRYCASTSLAEQIPVPNCTFQKLKKQLTPQFVNRKHSEKETQNGRRIGDIIFCHGKTPWEYVSPPLWRCISLYATVNSEAMKDRSVICHNIIVHICWKMQWRRVMVINAWLKIKTPGLSKYIRSWSAIFHQISYVFSCFTVNRLQ